MIIIVKIVKGCLKVVKRVNPKSFHGKENLFFFFSFFVYEMIDAFKLTVIIISLQTYV